MCHPKLIYCSEAHTCCELTGLTAARPTHAVYSLGTQQPEIPRVWLRTHSGVGDRRQVMRRYYQTPTPVATPWIDSEAYNNISIKQFLHFHGLRLPLYSIFHSTRSFIFMLSSLHSWFVHSLISSFHQCSPASYQIKTNVSLVFTTLLVDFIKVIRNTCWHFVHIFVEFIRSVYVQS